jgi:hypothetical protein
MRSQPGRPATAVQATGTKETTYALVSVLSHALQGAETLVHDLQDAEVAGDQDLVQFLREAQAWQRYLASLTQAVLQQRLHSGEGRVWNPDANIWHLILRPSPDCCLLGGVPHASAPFWEASLLPSFVRLAAPVLDAGLVGVAPWCSCNPPTQVWSWAYASLALRVALLCTR